MRLRADLATIRENAEMQMPKAMVTGANGGIGRALVKDLSRRGYRLIVHARTQEKARDVAAGVHTPVWGDLAKPDELEGVAGQVRSNTAQLDLLVHNAGVLTRSREKGGHGLGLQGEVNVLAPAKLTQLLMPVLRKGESPSVLIVSSGVVTMSRRNDYEALAEPDGSSLFGHYALSKSAANRLTLDLAKAYPDVRFVSVEPGFVSTNMTVGNASMPKLMGWLAPKVGTAPDKAARRLLDTALNDAPSGTVLNGTRRVTSGSWTRDGARENLAKLLKRAGVQVGDLTPA